MSKVQTEGESASEALKTLGTILGPAAIGVGGGILAGKKLFPTDEIAQLPLMAAGTYGGLFTGTALGIKREDDKLKEKGIRLSRSGNISQMTPTAIKKYAARSFSEYKRVSDKLFNKSLVAGAGLPLGGLIAGHVGTKDDDNRSRNAIGGALLGTAAAAGVNYNLAKKLKKVNDEGFSFGGFGDDFFGGGGPFGGGGGPFGGGGRGPGGGSRGRGFNRRGPSMDQAASDIGVKYKGGKFYDDAGNPITKKKDIKKAYRRSAMKFHPDRGGSEEKFKKVNNAFNDVIKNSRDFEKLSFLLKKHASDSKKSNKK